MKQIIKFFLLTLVLIAVLVGAYFAYQHFSDKQMLHNRSSSEDVASTAENAALVTDVKMTDMNGNDVMLSDFFGKPIVLNFWASWCGYCVREMPVFEAAYQEHGERVQFMMLNLTDGDRETVKIARSFLEESAYTFPVYFDIYGEALRAYDAYSIPITLFICSDGSLQKKHIGALDQNSLEEQINQLY